MKKLTSFEFAVYQRLKGVPLKGARLLVACSGGADSVALVQILSKIAPKLRFRLEILTVHHGDGNGVFRDQAVETVRRLARSKKLNFHVARYRGARKLVCEADLRAFRLRMIEKLGSQLNSTYFVFGHHADDLFETRLIRLLRGTGPQGLGAMQFLNEKTLRPLLFTRRSDLRDYAQKESLEWVEDPSNESVDPFRNWLRLDLLPSLEAKRPGSTVAFARSLEAIVEMCSTQVEETRNHLNENSLNRRQYRTWSSAEKRQAIAALLLRAGAISFGQSHIDEIRKRIEVPRKALQFSILGLQVEINAEQISVSKRTSSLT